MIWLIHDLPRYRIELAAVEALDANSNSFKLVEWRFDDSLRLCADADITIDDRVWPVTLRYGHNFPYAPPAVIPRVQERWSDHQYQRGELCLEYRSDNWIQSITGANMLESAYRLLLGETPHPKPEDRPAVPNAHEVTLGQKLRYRTSRFFYTQAFLENLPHAPAVSAAKFTDIGDKSEWRVCVSELSTTEGYHWKDPAVSHALVDRSYTWPGFLLHLDQNTVLPLDNPMSLLEHLAPELAKRGKDILPPVEMLLVCTPTLMRPFMMSHKSETVLELAVVPHTPGKRLAAAYAGLTDKRVGIIGCGSIGSKVAVTLARSGVANFVLIDDDLFGPENIVRNDLDWLSVAAHKGDALKKRLELINAAIEVDVRRQKLGGQESGATIDGTLSALGRCDLIIDASADAKAFNYASSVAVRNKRAMIWAEVFGGGFGGLIARSRPGLDPEPQLARAQILQWCEEQGMPAPLASEDYGLSGEEITFVADDADVSVLAAHLSRFGIDILLARAPSIFPYSAYMIGLAEQWLFKQPFDVYPIHLHMPESPSVEQGPQRSPQDQASIDELMKLIEKQS